MCEVTKKNFEEKYPKIIDDLHSALFISLDCEFSGLFDKDNRLSLFDSPKERYKKLQSSLEKYVIIQLGLTTFELDRIKNVFNASTYTFYLMPSSLVKPQSKITCQLGSIEFLCQHKFDFNKVFYEGINYLNKSEEKEALRMVEDDSFVENADEEKVQKYCSVVREWSGSAVKGSEMLLDLGNESRAFVYILHLEIRKRFFDVWTCDNKGVIRVVKVTELERRNLLLDKNEENKIKTKLLKALMGFSSIMKEIENLKKPIIGHNLLIDLIMIYQQFYNPSPVTYKEFKQSIHRIFPHVYDTKNISFNLLYILPRENAWPSNALSDLYHYFRYGRGATIVIFTPMINHEDEEYMFKEHFHNAGFDSFCTGFCFVKMSHIYSLWDAERKVFTASSIRATSSWLLAAVKHMKNHLNVSRGQVNHIVLDGPDPKSVRPGLLYIQSKDGHPLDISKISETIAKHPTVDIQLIGRQRGLMAVSNQRQAREILEHFRGHKQYKVTKYKFLKHSNLGRTIVAGLIFAPIITFLLFTLKTFRTVK